MNEVKVGQIWADVDSRMTGRTLRIEYVHTLLGRPVAVCTILTNAEGAVENRVGGRTTIAVGRFTDANYKLLRDAP